MGEGMSLRTNARGADRGVRHAAAPPPPPSHFLSTCLPAPAQVTECGMSLAAWQAKAPGVNDPGTVALKTPDDATLLALAKAALGLQ